MNITNASKKWQGKNARLGDFSSMCSGKKWGNHARFAPGYSNRYALSPGCCRFMHFLLYHILCVEIFDFAMESSKSSFGNEEHEMKE